MVLVWMVVIAGAALHPIDPAGALPLEWLDRAGGDVGSVQTGRPLTQVDPGSHPSPEGGAEADLQAPEPAPAAPGDEADGDATGPSPTGQARPDSSQRTLDTVIWVGLLAALAVAVVIVVRVWRDVGVDPPLVDIGAPPRGERPDADR